MKKGRFHVISAYLIFLMKAGEGDKYILLDTKACFDSIFNHMFRIISQNASKFLRQLNDFTHNCDGDICGGERRHLRLEIVGGVDERARG